MTQLVGISNTTSKATFDAQLHSVRFSPFGHFAHIAAGMDQLGSTVYYAHGSYPQVSRNAFLTQSSKSESAKRTVAYDMTFLKNALLLREISMLEDDWNDDGAPKFSEECIALAQRVINNLPTQPLIAPTFRGTVYMEYKRSDRSSLAFEIGENVVDIAYIPQQNFELAIEKKITENIIAIIRKDVIDFYEP